MTTLEDKFKLLATDNAPGQEVRQSAGDIATLMRGEILSGRPVDFSHGDVDAFTPTPGSLDAFLNGVGQGGQQAYTEYRGASEIRRTVARRLADFTGAPVDADEGLIITPGTQGALFLAMAATVAANDKVAIVQPDYFANRKLALFFGGEICPVRLDYLSGDDAGLDLSDLKAAFESGAQVFVFSNPNNPAGAVYSAEEISSIVALADAYDATVIVDQLYSRLRYDNCAYTHLRAESTGASRVITIMGPSKTESLSGYRLGVAFGAPEIIERMEKLQAIVSLRAAGYNQAVLNTWFAEPEGWMDERIRLHQNIRDDLLDVFRAAGMQVRTPQAGSYLFPQMPELTLAPADLVKLLRHQANVIVTPGSEFGPHCLSSFRLNFSQDHSAAVAAAHRIVEMAEFYAR